MKQRDIAILLIPIFIVTLFWVIFNVYHNYVTSTITDPLNRHIVPIQGKFDSQTISEIKSRKRVESSSSSLSSNDISPSPSINEDNATTSANINENQEDNE